MFSKTNLVSTILTALWAYFGGFLFWGYLSINFFKDHFESATGVMKDTPDILYLILGCIINAFVFSTLYGRWANNKYSAGSGIIFGIWLAIFLGLGEGFIDYATSNILDLSGTLANFGIYLAFLGIMGLLAGVIYKNIR